MGKPRVSLVAPTRGRVAQLDRMMLSATDLASGEIEIVLRCDFDDPETIAYLRTVGAPFIVGPRLRGYATLAVLVNEAARLSHADLVMVVNDDAEFVTHGWDDMLLAAAEPYDDGIFNLGVETENADNFIFPCTSRRMVNLIGIHDERLVYSDIWLRDVMLAFGRAVRVPNVRVRHLWQGQSEDQARAVAEAAPGMHAKCVEEAVLKIRESYQMATRS